MHSIYLLHGVNMILHAVTLLRFSYHDEAEWIYSAV